MFGYCFMFAVEIFCVMLRITNVATKGHPKEHNGPPSGELDTCYNFTGQPIVIVSTIRLSFEGGANPALGLEHMLYFKDRGNTLSQVCRPMHMESAHRAYRLLGTKEATCHDAGGLRPINVERMLIIMGASTHTSHVGVPAVCFL